MVARADLPEERSDSAHDLPQELRGIVDVSLDERGRMAIPGRYREAFANGDGGRAVVTIDRQERCLLVYPPAEWTTVQEGLKALHNASRRVRKVQRMLIGFAFDIEIDRQGRLLIPPKLREYSGIDRKAILLGQLNKLELWSAESWQENMKGWPDQAEADEEELRDLRI